MSQHKQANGVTPGKFYIEPPTLIALGFEWYIDGDANHNAEVAVRYRREGHAEWRQAQPLLRIQNEESITRFLNNGIDYVTPNMFAGSIFDLEPDTAYECEFTLTDPDGVFGESRITVLTRTRPEPEPFPDGKTYHVYPPDYQGAKEEPSFPNLMAAYYTGWCEADWWNTAPPRVQPGDTILIHSGVYQDDWTLYGNDIWGHGLGTPFQGTHYLIAKGTAARPIAIIAAGDGDVVFDGNGNFNLFNLLAADHHYFEGITFRNTYVALLAGNKKIAGCSGLTVKHCRFEDLDKGIHGDWAGAKNFYIADNIFVGRHDPRLPAGLVSGTHSRACPPPHFPHGRCRSEYAVKVAGAGHVICHNYVAHFHDGIDHATYGVPDGYPPYRHPKEYPLETVFEEDGRFVAIDIYNNLIINMHDNFIEADGAMHNIRIMRNLCINAASHALSSQTLFGGPAYFIRNIVYHAPNSVKHAQHPSGIIYYHNTFAARMAAEAASNCHLRNNLILGWWPGEPLFSMDTFTNYSSSDHNGFCPDPGAAVSFIWTSPPFETPRDFSGDRIKREFPSLEAFSRATGQDRHSILVDYDSFAGLVRADVDDFTKIYGAGDVDVSLRPASPARNAGCILPNVNDGFTGTAPDLGALESGQAVPVYGPRPQASKAMASHRDPTKDLGGDTG